tara:strand:+ start:260 stop:598 length:339 start_codon:yes stop_codon:yes gene_type:complete
MESFIKELRNSKNNNLKTVVNYIVNTIKSKALYNIGGWDEVKKNYNDLECFNHNYSISSTAICMKLRENKETISIPIQDNMKNIEIAVNNLLGVNAIEYYVNKKNHTLKIVL